MSEPKRRFLEIVLITWIDSETEIGWEDAEAFITGFKPNYSLGFLIQEDGEKYVLASDYDKENEHFNRIIRIPKVCVRKLRVVTLVTFP